MGQSVPTKWNGKPKKGDISLDICNKIEESINGYLKMKIMDLKEKNSIIAFQWEWLKVF